jgi:hypothetical protein
MRIMATTANGGPGNTGATENVTASITNTKNVAKRNIVITQRKEAPDEHTGGFYYTNIS